MKQHKIGLGIAFAVALGIAAPGLAQQAVQWRVEDGGNGHWYRWVRQPAGVSWTAARNACIQAGGHLATPTSFGENQFIFALTLPISGWQNRFGPWLGGFQDFAGTTYSEPAGGWKWVSGEPWSWASWGWGEPNNSSCGGPEESLHYIDYQPYWNDGRDTLGLSNPCDPPNWSYVVEWSADCNGDGIVDYGQILQGQLADTDSNGIPDICEVDPCPSDIDENGVTDAIDLAVILGRWGTNPKDYPRADANNDGTVDANDLAIVLSGWGNCP